MKRILSTLTLLLCFAFTAVNAQDNYNATTMGAIVKHYETAKWAQGSPFNNQCWTDATQTTHAKTGCVPTAFAIIMRHHGFPTEGIGTLKNGQTGEQFADRTYDYSKMPLTNGSGWTAEQQNEVAKLISHLGHAFGVTWGTAETSVSIGNTMSERMQMYFNYNYTPVSNQYAGSGQMYDFETWKNNLKNSLLNGCPVPYASNNQISGGRHMFIVDGFTENDYFHFNFGWGGGTDGWFKLDDITPTGDNYSWLNSSDGYDSKHQAYFNLSPNVTKYDVTATVNDSNMGTVSINGGTAGSTATASLMQGVTATLTAHPADGYALASWTKGGEIVGSRTTLQVPVGTSDNDYVANFDEAANVLVVKEYTVNPANGSLSGGTSKYSTWTSTDTQPALTLKATNASGAAVYAISALSSSYKAYATAYDSSDKAHTNITYTLSVPEGYVITNYLMTYNVGTAGQISLNGELLNATGDHTLSAAPNAQTASFTLSVSSAGQQYITVKSIAVTVQSEGGASTPTPDPEPEPDPTPTTYAVTTTANPAAGGTAKFAVGTGSQQTQGDVENGTQITLYATANTGYNFVNWTLGGSVVSTDATCNVNVAQASNYVANFEAEAQEPEQNVTGTIVGVNRIPTERFDLSQGLQTGYYLLKQVNNNASAASGQGVGWIKAANETVGASATSKNTRTPSATDNTYIWYVEVVNAENNLITISTANKVAAWQAPWQREKTLVAYANKATLKYHTGTVNLSGNATPNAGSCFISNEETTAFVHFSGDNLGSWNDTNQNSMFMVEFYKLSIDDLVQKNIVTFEGATYTKTDGTELTSGWGYQVVTQTTPAVTIKVAETKNNFGYTTGVISGVKTPYLYKNTNFILSISEQYKITGYKITVRGQDNSYSGDFTCSVGGNETSKATLSGTTTQTLSATDLNTNTINIAVGGTAGNGIFITALEITYIENEFEPLPFKAEIDGWRNNNPNTHLGTITIGGTPLKLTPEHLTASELTMSLGEGTTLAFTRKYRGFEFQGFYIGETSLGTNPTLTAGNVAAINENNPLVAKFTATDDVTLFYDDATSSYRIPAIAKTGTNRLVAISDYRHNLDDIGYDNHGAGNKRIDLVMRTSDDNGATWSDIKTIAAGDNSQTGSWLRAFGDAAVAAYGNNILVMSAAGDVAYPDGTTSTPNRMARIYSTDNGVTWTKEEMTTKMYSTATSLFPDGGSAFFGSGKLAVDPNFNGTGNARIYGAVLIKMNGYTDNNFVVYSDDFGVTWKVLGGDNANPIAHADEPKVEILPNGQILLSSRRWGGRTFNVFTYGTGANDKANGVGTWDAAAVEGCSNEGQNGTNGEIICLDAKRTNGKPTKILLQSQPHGGTSRYDRKNVTIWYKEISADKTYTAAEIAGNWTKGKQVSTVQSSYSAMCLQQNGEIAFFFEEAPCYRDDYQCGYCMVYVPLTIEEATDGAFLNPNADIEYVPVEFNIVLTDTEGNTYRETLDYVPDDVAAVLTAKYPFITLGANYELTSSDNVYTYTNTVTLPFKVSNATNIWHNIYYPANSNDNPNYIAALDEDEVVDMAASGSHAYGANTTYNTLDGNSKISWAIYNVNDSFEFIFKNELTGKYIKVESVSSETTENVKFVENAEDATAFTLLAKETVDLTGVTPAVTGDCDFALVANVGNATGYLCATSSSKSFLTHFERYNHRGAWVKIVEAPDYQTIIDQLIADIDNFGAGEGKYTANDAISSIDKDALATMPINTLNTQKGNVQTVKDSYSEITLTVPAVNDVVPGSVMILDEEVSHKFVPKGNVTIEAFPAAGYRFVNWTRPAAAQASAAARTAAARNSNVVSDQNPYTVTVSEALSLEANFEEIVVNVTLTDAQGNTYEVQVSGFTSGVTKETVAAKLKEKYPYITLGSTDQNGDVMDFGVLEVNGTAYTYTNKVELPFKVSNAAYLWHNIYYPANSNDNPNYIAALNEDEVVDMAASGGYAYGDNPTYNTKDGGNSICWAIYNVNNSFEFIFKSRVTGKYIKVESVSSETTENVKFVENAEDATAFTLLAKETVDLTGVTPAVSGDCDFALVANVEDATGYLCATSSSKSFLTHFERYNHRGAWVKIVEAPDYFSMIQDLGIVLGLKFGPGDGKCIITPSIQEVIDAMQNSSSITTLNTLTEYSSRLEDSMNNWPAVGLTINPVEGGTTNINGEENVVHKYVPNDYGLTLVATPAVGYHFVSWTDGTSEVETAEYTKTINGGKGDVIELTANFAKDTYTVSVTAGDGGSANASAATVEHGSEVTLTATPSTGYSFAGWYDGENLISAEASYTFTVTSHINYTARFNEVPTGTVAIHITVASTDGTTVTNNATGNVKAIINNIGQEWATDADFVVGADVELVATNDYGQNAYLFDGWYKNGVLVSNDLEITVQATEVATYEARFFRGCVVIGNSSNNRFGYIKSITLADGTSIGYDASNRAIVKPGTTVKINTFINMYGYEVGSWTNANDEIVSTDKDLIVVVNEDVTYTAIVEAASYNLTVRANDDERGTVSATSGTSTGTTVKVGHNMEATITATANDGFYFVNWTKGTDVVSTEATYTIPGIADVEDMLDAEYIANFVEADALDAGYYRIAYDFEVPVAAKSAATRAVGDVVTYVVSTSTGSFSNDSIWTSTLNNNPAGLKMLATNNNGKTIASIIPYSTNEYHNFSLKAGGQIGTTDYYSTTYTLSVAPGFKITGYEMTYYPSTDGMVTLTTDFGYTRTPESSLNDYVVRSSDYEFTESEETKFVVSTSAGKLNYSIRIVNFEVYIQEVGGGETPEPGTETVRYYVQSDAVSGTNNAMPMTTDGEGVASIFYYDGGKLLSYQKGTYVKEDGTTCGLQDVGAYGDAMIKVVGTNDEDENICTIAAPYFMHANSSNGYYVSNCGATSTCDEHNFILEKVTSLPVTISAAGYASWYAPVAVELPANVEAWYFEGKIGYKGEDKYAIMTPIGGNVVPANTGVILGGLAGKYELEIIETETEIDGNLLSGTVAATYVTGDAYVLANGNNGLGLYLAKKNNNNAWKNNSHKAYLLKDDLPSSAQHISGFRFSFGDDNTTPIEEMETESSEVKGIYDLTGRKLEGISGTGIYIINGKKVLVK